MAERSEHLTRDAEVRMPAVRALDGAQEGQRDTAELGGGHAAGLVSCLRLK